MPNVASPTHFGCGHERTRANMHFKNGNVKCAICANAYSASWRQKQKEAALLAAAQPHLHPKSNLA